jgi:phage shock protein C
MGAFPWTLIAYVLTAWIAADKPAGLYEDAAEAAFWQGVRQSPGRSTRDVRSTFRDLDRRLADVELHYTASNRRLAEEIDRLK